LPREELEDLLLVIDARPPDQALEVEQRGLSTAASRGRTPCCNGGWRSAYSDLGTRGLAERRTMVAGMSAARAIAEAL